MSSYKVPQNLLYTETHEWVEAINGEIRVGITDYAQSKLGDVVYVELPPTGKKFNKSEKVCEIESVKTVAEIYAPVTGVITEVNEKLSDAPELVNEDPYGEGWIFKMSVEDPSQLNTLLPPEKYVELQEEE